MIIPNIFFCECLETEFSGPSITFESDLPERSISSCQLEKQLTFSKNTIENHDEKLCFRREMI